MKTDALIDELAQAPQAAEAHHVTRTLATGVGLGALVSFVAMFAWLGVRPDLMDAMATAMYWMKFLYTLLFAVAGFWTVERLARPGAGSRRQMILEALPFAVVALLALLQLMTASDDARMPMTMGHSSQVCPWRIAVLALPVFLGALTALRRLAPTRPVVSGAAAGLLAGAAGAFIYAFHCDESAMPFLAVWYTFGIIVMGAVGAAAGRLFLRW